MFKGSSKKNFVIQHKESGKWLTYDGKLTDDLNNKGLLRFEEDWIAAKWFGPQEPTVNTDFSGRNVSTDYTFVGMHNQLKEQIAENNNGANLYTDFIVTEQKFD